MVHADVLAAGVALVVPPLAPDAARMLGITAFCAALIGIRLIGVSFSAELALTGFRSPATWLVVVGLLIGAAAGKSGLARLVKRLTLDRMSEQAVGDAVAAYRYPLVTLAVGSVALAVLIPSSLM